MLLLVAIEMLLFESTVLKDLKDLLQTHASLERYITWLDSIVEKKVSPDVANNKHADMKDSLLLY